MTTKSDHSSNSSALLGVCLVVASLYFARDVLIPIALAILFAFLVAPLAKYFETWHLGRIAASLTAVFIALLIAGALSYCVAIQFGKFGKELPKYQANIHEKLRRFSADGSGVLTRAENTLQDFRKDLTTTNTATNANASTNSIPTKTAAAPPAKAETKSRDSSSDISGASLFQMARNIIGPSLNFLVTLFLVTVFCIFMLIERDDLRARLNRIVGSRNAKLTSQLSDEIGARVSRYLRMQLIVNVTYGIPLGLGLWLIGIPNPLLWGMVASLFRYIPYAGPWIAASLPFAVGFAVDSGWTKPFLVLALFAVVEILTANLVEPWLYGNSTGITPLAVLLAAVFWTWVWGPVGLLLSMPLTVCVVSIARYVPQLEMLDHLFGESKPDARHHKSARGHSSGEHSLTFSRETRPSGK